MLAKHSIRWNSILLFCLLIHFSSAFEVLHPPHLVGFYNSPWLSRYGPENPPDDVVGRLVSSFTDKAGPVEGNIVLGCEAGFERTMELSITKYQNLGAIGYMNCARFSTVPGILNRLFDGSDISNISILSWDTALVDIRPILDYFRSGEENITVIVKMGFNDRNEWDEMYATIAFLPYSIIIALYAGAAVIFATIKLVMYMRAKGPELSIPQTCFWIEIFANLERLIYHGIDPLWSRVIFPQAAGNILLTLSVPVFATTTLLITFYWKELLESKKFKVVTFINRMKWPFVAAAFVFWGAELSASFCRGFGVGPVATLAVIAAVIYGVCIVFTSVLFFYYGHKLLELAKNRRANYKTESKFKAIKLLMASGILSLLFVLLVAFAATPYLFLPWGFFTGNLLNAVLLITISMIQIAAFAPPNISLKASSKTRLLWLSFLYFFGSRSTSKAVSLPRQDTTPLTGNSVNMESIESPSRDLEARNTDRPEDDKEESSSESSHKEEINSEVSHKKESNSEDSNSEHESEESSEEEEESSLSEADANSASASSANSSH